MCDDDNRHEWTVLTSRWVEPSRWKLQQINTQHTTRLRFEIIVQQQTHIIHDILYNSEINNLCFYFYCHQPKKKVQNLDGWNSFCCKQVNTRALNVVRLFKLFWSSASTSQTTQHSMSSLDYQMVATLHENCFFRDQAWLVVVSDSRRIETCVDVWIWKLMMIKEKYKNSYDHQHRYRYDWRMRSFYTWDFIAARAHVIYDVGPWDVFR